MEAAILEVASNPLTFFKLIETIAFQVGLLGGGLLILALVIVPRITNMEARAMFYKRGVSRALRLLVPFTFKGIWFILLVGTLGILLTDVGWLKAFSRYGFPLDFLLARASGAPNGAHLLSYIPLPLLGLYVAYKYRKDVLLDCFQGILVVAFGVAVHELIWLVAYWAHYASYWNFGVATNVAEDAFFTVMCLMFVYAWWKYPFRSIPLSAFKWPVVAYAGFVAVWFLMGLPISTINNWQLGEGIYMVTPLWADPLTNFMEIAGWIFVAASFFLAIWRER